MTTDRERLKFLRVASDECHVDAATHQKQPSMCGGMPVAVAVNGDDRWWPVCALHSRGRRLVPLTELLAVAEENSWCLDEEPE